MKKMLKCKIQEIVDNYVKQILKEVINKETTELNIYDFDDTLVKTSGTIHLINTTTGIRKELSAHEFHEYQLKDNEKFDIDDFNIIKEPEILPHLSRMKADYQRLGPLGVAICTARPEADAVYDFISDHGMPDIEIIALGDAVPKGNVGQINANRKKAWIKSKLKDGKIKILRFFDDNVQNITAAKTLIEEFPEVYFEIELVK